MNTLALRLRPQQDLRQELDNFVTEHHLEAACVVTCVGSLALAVLRFAGSAEASVYEGKFEIVALSGVMSVDGSHYHISIADHTGQAIGGHLLKGSLIYTTAEVVIAVLPDLRFRRVYDPATGYLELAIDPQ